MQPTVQQVIAVETIRVRVRQNVAPAAIGTAFLVYFGFFAMAEPVGTDLFHRAGWVFYHTLRLGGLAMGAIAIWSMIGQPITLVVDAVVTVLIGVLLVLTGLAMAVDGGAMIQTIINVVCGGMFISSGVRNGKDYFFYTSTRVSDVSPPRTAGAEELDQRPRPLREPHQTPPVPFQKSVDPIQMKGSKDPGNSQGHVDSATPIAPPPEGFLASMAKKRLPTDDEGLPR